MSPPSLDFVTSDVPLGPYTTYKAGGPARYFAELKTHSELAALMESGLLQTQETLVLGRGSNLVVADEGFDGLVLHLSGEFASVSMEDATARAGSAVPLPRLARHVLEAGRVGLEFFVGVPGSVGGAVRQNAGCFGRETADVLIDAELVDLVTGDREVREPTSLDLGYRSSNVKTSELVLSARFRTADGDLESSRSEMREITRWRREHQPGGTLNAGSVFKNPEGDAAGRIIDSLGLKGTRVGGVSVSEKHANFFVAEPNAKAADIRDLIKRVKDAVAASTGTILETELQLVGFNDDH